MYYVLLSGGSGRRLWPLSNEARPKQFIRAVKKEKPSEENTQETADEENEDDGA